MMRAEVEFERRYVIATDINRIGGGNPIGKYDWLLARPARKPFIWQRRTTIQEINATLPSALTLWTIPIEQWVAEGAFTCLGLTSLDSIDGGYFGERSKNGGTAGIFRRHFARSPS